MMAEALKAMKKYIEEESTLKARGARCLHLSFVRMYTIYNKTYSRMPQAVLTTIRTRIPERTSNKTQTQFRYNRRMSHCSLCQCESDSDDEI